MHPIYATLKAWTNCFITHCEKKNSLANQATGRHYRAQRDYDVRSRYIMLCFVAFFLLMLNTWLKIVLTVKSFENNRFFEKNGQNFMGQIIACLKLALILRNEHAICGDNKNKVILIIKTNDQNSTVSQFLDEVGVHRLPIA